MNTITEETRIKMKESRKTATTINNPVEKYFNVKKTEGIVKSRSLAIKAKCADCCGCGVDYIEVGFRDIIRECNITSCPLHDFRPYQSK